VTRASGWIWVVCTGSDARDGRHAGLVCPAAVGISRGFQEALESAETRDSTDGPTAYDDSQGDCTVGPVRGARFCPYLPENLRRITLSSSLWKKALVTGDETTLPA
jgi:hypothetical protein